MVTYAMFIARFPEFTTVSELRFDIFFGDSVLEMGSEEARWSGVYNVAQANLVAHFLIVGQGSETGDSMALMPIRSTDVDDVIVEYAVEKNVEGTGADNFSASIYGQQYLHWRNMAFAGARVIH